MPKEDDASVSIEQQIKNKMDPDDQFILEENGNLILDDEKIVELNSSDKKFLS